MKTQFCSANAPRHSFRLTRLSGEILLCVLSASRAETRLRAQMKQAEDLSAQGQSPSMIAASLRHPPSRIKRWLANAKRNLKIKGKPWLTICRLIEFLNEKIAGTQPSLGQAPPFSGRTGITLCTYFDVPEPSSSPRALLESPPGFRFPG